MNSLRPTTKGLMVIFLGILVLYAFYKGDMTTVSLIVGGFIGILKQED